MISMDSPPSWHLLWGLWSDNTTVGRIIILAILGLLVVAWVSTLRHRKRYRISEARSLGWAENNLQVWREVTTAKPMEEGAVDAEGEGGTEGGGGAEDDVEDGEIDRPDPHREMPLAEIPRLMENTAVGSLIRGRLEAIENLRRYHLKIDVEALQQLSLNLEETRIGLKIPSFVVGMSMMLGMLGTFIGLSTVVSDINFHLPEAAADISVATWQQSIQNIRMVLAGMKTAFSTTLVGIICALLASYWDFRLRQEQARFMERFDRFTTEDLMAATIPTFEDESLIQRVSRQLDESFSDVQDLFESNRETVRELTAAEQGFLRLVEEIQEATRQDPSSNLGQVATEMIQTNTSLVGVVEHLPRMTQTLERGHRELSRHLKDLSRALEIRVQEPARSFQLAQPVTFGLILLATALIFWLVR